jgi:hypothetical protein
MPPRESSFSSTTSTSPALRATRDRPVGGYQRDGVQVADDGVILDGRVAVRHDASR